MYSKIPRWNKMKNLSTVIFFLITCNQKVLSRRLQNTIDDNLYLAKPYSISNGAAPPYEAWRHVDYDDEHEHKHHIIFPDVDWSDAIPSWTSQRKIQQCVTSCQPNSVHQYQPVCGTNGVTYHNLEHMECSMKCGVDVNIRQMSPCPGWSGTTARPTQEPQTTTAKPTTTTFNIQQACMSSCPSTSEYNPVCGSDNITYDNHGKLICAQWCGKDVQVLRRSPCPKKTFNVGVVVSTTPAPQSTTPSSATSTAAAYHACISSCPTTNEYNPVCGSDGVTYDNHGKLICAQICGKDVQEVRRSPCPKIKATVETVSTNTTPRSTFSGSSNKVRRCMSHCLTDPLYDPVCGTNMETFYNLSRLQCAINCGVDVSLLKSVACHIKVKSEDDEDVDIDIRYTDS